MRSYIVSLLVPLALMASLPDLEKGAHEFVLEEKQISIPGHPGAFNPSIVRWNNGKLLLSFRSWESGVPFPNLIGFVWLTEEFEVEGEPMMLSIYGDRELTVSRAQDPRLIQVGDIYYIVYNNILSDSDLEVRRMVWAPLQYGDKGFFIENPQYITEFEGDIKNWREKNWAPFDLNGKLAFSYSLNPHRVFEPLHGTEECKTLAVTTAQIDWKWGELRGGTPALLEGGEYFGFFHTFIDMKSVQSKGKKISHYFMGAYRFQSEYPYALTQISPEPILGKEFYTPPDYPTWKPLRVVFPGGLIFNDQFIWVVYGRQDFETWVVKMDKKALLESLISVSEG
jgi:predicted GH43/DUF377 family glycosyl hydrolase